jgi:S1-C subfamily serine protease
LGFGSGVVISPDGEILTNHHVAGSRAVGASWFVRLPGRGILEARVIGHDPQGDLSLLRLVRPGPYPYVELASDGPRPGDITIALGNAFGYAKDAVPSVAQGVVSAVHRYQGRFPDAIQTDAAVNPGNSGGPLLDASGRLVGINTFIGVRHGVKANTGVGYAIPSSRIRRFLTALRKGGVVRHAKLDGLSVANTERGGEGARVTRVAPKSRAAEAGLRPGDIIIGVDGTAVPSVTRLHGLLDRPVGERVELTVRRGAKTISLGTVLAVPPEKPGRARLGILMSHEDEDDGVRVAEVDAGSPAARAGLREGDRVLAIDGLRVGSIDEVVSALSEKRPGETIAITLGRGGRTLSVRATLGERVPHGASDEES